MSRVATPAPTEGFFSQNLTHQLGCDGIAAWSRVIFPRRSMEGGPGCYNDEGAATGNNCRIRREASTALVRLDMVGGGMHVDE